MSALSSISSVNKCVVQESIKLPSDAPASSPIKASDILANSSAKKSNSTSLVAQVKQIPTGCLEFVKDDRWMAITSLLFGSASNICSLIGTTAAKFLPYLTILSSPVYLYHSIKEQKERFKMMICAFKTHNFVDMCFWAGKGIGSVGSTLSDIIKPFAGGVILFGVSKIASVAFTFSFVLPIILIILSSIGSTTEGWALFRTVKSLNQMNKKIKELDGSYDSLKRFLAELQGPQDKSMLARLKAANIGENYFTTYSRQQIVQMRINRLLGIDEKAKMRPVQEAIDKILPLIQQGYTLSCDTHPEAVEQVIALCEQLIKLSCQWKTKDPSILKIVQELKERHSQLLVLKSALYQEGLEIMDMAAKEIQNKLLEQILCITSAAITFAAAILLLQYPQYSQAAFAISLSSSLLSIFTVILHKSSRYGRVSQNLVAELDVQK